MRTFEGEEQSSLVMKDVLKILCVGGWVGIRLHDVCHILSVNGMGIS